MKNCQHDMKVQPRWSYSLWLDTLCSNWKDSTLSQSAVVPWQATVCISLLFLSWAKGMSWASKAGGSSWGGTPWCFKEEVRATHPKQTQNKVYSYLAEIDQRIQGKCPLTQFFSFFMSVVNDAVEGRISFLNIVSQMYPLMQSHHL